MYHLEMWKNFPDKVRFVLPPCSSTHHGAHEVKPVVETQSDDSRVRKVVYLKIMKTVDGKL